MKGETRSGGRSTEHIVGERAGKDVNVDANCR